MPSNTLVAYFETLQRCDLEEINAGLRRAQVDSDQHNQGNFPDEGVLVVEDVFTHHEIADANSACDRLELVVQNDLVSYSDINLEATGGGWRGQNGTIVSHAGQIRKVKNLIDHGPEFRHLASHPSLLGIIASILGPDFGLHSKGFLMNKPPEVSTEKPWHQDGAYFDTPDQVITIWIPLQDVDHVNGCLHGIPGSHRWGKLPHLGAEAQLDKVTIPLDQARQYPVKQGGVCIMDKLTAHYSGINQSLNPRRALIFRYQKTSPSPTPLNGENTPLGGSVSPTLLRGEHESKIEKRHLITARVLREAAQARQIEFLDMGTDYLYPFYSAYKPTQDAMRALGLHTERALCYPSSFGLESLRRVFQRFMASRFGVHLDFKTEIMINTGASQAFDALSRAFEGRYVLLPELSLPTVGVIASGNGAELLRLPVDQDSGMIDLHLAQLTLDKLPPRSVRFLYFNSPVNPTGQVASLEHLTQLVQLAKRNGIVVVHDMDSWYTQHLSGSDRLHNILEVPGATSCCVAVLSISKEFGLPGLRVGLIAGNRRVVDAIRMHNSTFAVMIPEVCQLAAQAALEAFLEETEGDKAAINTHVTSLVHRSIAGWKSLGWPEHVLRPPVGGFKYLIPIPPSLLSESESGYPAVELLDYYIASRAAVKLSTSRSFNPDEEGFIRMVVMQNAEKVDEVFERLRACGVRYDGDMRLPEGLAAEYEAFLREYERGGAGDDF